MRGITVVLYKEWRGFLGTDSGALAIYAFLVVMWGLLLFSTGTQQTGMDMRVVWLLTFAVVVNSNFAQSVLVGERVTGAFEILLTCGLSRPAILWGKVLFVSILSTTLGCLCMALSLLASQTAQGILGRAGALGWSDAVLFAAAAFMNAGASGFLSIFLPNPRMTHFVNFLGAGMLISVYYTVIRALPYPDLLFSALLVLVGLLSMVIAQRGFEGERIVRSVSV